jgi:hypothetical protein
MVRINFTPEKKERYIRNKNEESLNNNGNLLCQKLKSSNLVQFIITEHNNERSETRYTSYNKEELTNITVLQVHKSVKHD